MERTGRESGSLEVTKGHALPPSRTIPWIALASSLALLGGCASSDGSPRADGIEVGTTHQAIFAGTADNDEAASAGVVSIKIGNGTSFELCTGSLLAPNVVLTARHCVSKTLKTVVSCNELGQSGNGDHVGDDEVLSDVHVYSGERPAFGGPPSAGVSAVVHPDGGVLCNADIALLVLDGPITDVSPMRVRLSSAPRSGESFRAVGYGQNDDKLPVGTRIRKDAVKVLAIGQKVSASQTPLGRRLGRRSRTERHGFVMSRPRPIAGTTVHLSLLAEHALTSYATKVNFRLGRRCPIRPAAPGARAIVYGAAG